MIMLIFRVIHKICRMILGRYHLYIFQHRYHTKKNIIIHNGVQMNNPHIIFGNDVTLYSGVQIWGDGVITIGNNVSIGKDTIIFSHASITIGDNTLIAGQCYIIDCDHGIKKDELICKQPLETKLIYIGKDVWIGAGSKILKGAYISDGSVIGALGLVKNRTEPYSINVGIPTHCICYRR